MSDASKRARAERRAADREVVVTGVEYDEATGKASISVEGAGMLRAIPGMYAEGGFIRHEDGTAETVMFANIRAIAVIADQGGYRVAVLSLPPSVAEAHTVTVTDPESMDIQIHRAHAALEDAARGMDPEGKPRARECPACGAAALVRHPSKSIDLCAACNARHEVNA